MTTDISDKKITRDINTQEGTTYNPKLRKYIHTYIHIYLRNQSSKSYMIWQMQSPDRQDHKTIGDPLPTCYFNNPNQSAIIHCCDAKWFI